MAKSANSMQNTTHVNRINTYMCVTLNMIGSYNNYIELFYRFLINIKWTNDIDKNHTCVLLILFLYHTIRMECMHVIVIEGITDVLQVFS